MLDVPVVLGSFPPEFQPLKVAPLGNGGGMSGATIWRITARRGELALRRWPTEHPAQEQLRWIHDVLRHAANAGIDYVPVPIEALDGRTFVRHAGHLWELARWMPGCADYATSPRIEKLRAALVALGRFHEATADFSLPPKTDLNSSGYSEETGEAALALARNPELAISPGITRRLESLRTLFAGRASVLAKSIDNDCWPELAKMARQFLALLPYAAPRAIAELMPIADIPLAIQPCLRDIWHDHLFFTGNEVTGIIDFGAMGRDTPATDIARLLGSLVGDDRIAWQAGLAAYQSIRPLTARELRAVSAFDVSGTVLSGCNWIRWIYVERRLFVDQQRVIERFAKILSRAETAAAS